jgi:hypothetical protein
VRGRSGGDQEADGGAIPPYTPLAGSPPGDAPLALRIASGRPASQTLKAHTRHGHDQAYATRR